MVFLDFKVATQNVVATYGGKVKCSVDDTLGAVVNAGLSNYLTASDETPDDFALNNVVGRIKSVKCKDIELRDYLTDSDATLDALSSESTPIAKIGLRVLLEPLVAARALTAPNTKKVELSSMAELNDVLRGKRKEVDYLKVEVDMDSDPNLQDQLSLALALQMEETFKLGYCGEKQMKQLKKNVGHLNNSLCFFQKHWKSLLGCQFPEMPPQYNESILLGTVALTSRDLKSSKKVNISQSKVEHHLNTLQRLQWDHFASNKELRQSVAGVMSEVEKFLVKVLSLKNDELKKDANSKKRSCPFEDAPATAKPKVSSAFKKKNAVLSSNGEFIIQIDSTLAKKGKKKTRSLSTFGLAVRSSVANVYQKLSRTDCYKPLFLSDEEMGIDTYAERVLGDGFLSPEERKRYRCQFRDELAKGHESMCITVWGTSTSGYGQLADTIFVWRVPVVPGSTHGGNTAKAVQECKEVAPKRVSAEVVKNFNHIINGIANVPKQLRDALANYIFRGDANPDNELEEEYVKFVLDLAAGQPINPELLVDGRAGNSRGGRGIGSTMFTAFWEACRQVLLPNASTEERRQDDVLYASGANSIADLKSQATEILQKLVSNGEIDVLPPIPDESWIRLQFVPNVTTNALAEKFTGALGVIRNVQTRTLRKEHPDQHFVNALTRYYLEWIIELRKNYSGIEFFGQDDKAKIPVGDKVPVATGVRPGKLKGFAPVDGPNPMGAMDHDFHNSNIIPSVELRCNIPNDISGSFFLGDKESGFGQIFVSLKDATFEPSNIFDHCASLISTTRKIGLNPTVLVLQTDGGPDHSLKRVAVQLALVGMFKELDLDHLVVLRGAPNGSARNKVERSMSILNIGAANVSLKRGQMPEWAEKRVSHCGSMQAVRDEARKVDAQREKALEQVRDLEEKLAASETASASATEDNSATEQSTNSAMTAAQASAASVQPTNLVGALSAASGSVSVVTNPQLSTTVLKARLDKVSGVASRDLEKEWKLSMEKPMKALAARFGRLTAGNHNVAVHPKPPESASKVLHRHLQEIDSKYTPSVNKKCHLDQVPDAVSWMSDHCLLTPYSLSIQKCSQKDCCGEIRTPDEHCQLAMQRQPLPRLDKHRPGHFLSRDASLKKYAKADNEHALTDMTDMPSFAQEKESDAKKMHAKRDKQMNADLGLRGWENKKVRGFLTCYNCGKRRCLYTKTVEDWDGAVNTVKQVIESLGHRYSCGDLLFDGDHPLSKVVVQKQSLTCESTIEIGYYNPSNAGDRVLRAKDICVHCGETGPTDFLLRLPQLREKNMTEGWHMLPTCVNCIAAGKKRIKKSGKKNEFQAQKEKRAKAVAARSST